LRASSDASAGLVLTLVVAVSSGLSAHRLDEYLQAARLSIGQGGVEVDLNLTPGVVVADRVIADLDRDRDGSLSEDEKRAYARQVLDAIQLQNDGRSLRLAPITTAFPDLEAFRHGEGTIQIRAAAVLPRLSTGDHRLTFRNTYRRDVSVYLANALLPDSDRIAITAQHRDGDQRDLTIDYVVRQQSAALSTIVGLLGGLAWAVALAARITDHRNQRHVAIDARRSASPRSIRTGQRDTATTQPAARRLRGRDS
jgi:hypothetical protein